jgi:hypothetical protein
VWSRGGVGADVRACSFSMRPIVNVVVCRVFRRESSIAVKSRQTASDVLVMAVLGGTVVRVLAGKRLSR